MLTPDTGTPPSALEVELKFRTAPSQAYPGKIQDTTRIGITLPARYPFEEPAVTITTPIFHPNVWSTGRICLGSKWMPSMGLDLLVRRVIQIVTFDPTVLNMASPANGGAVTWYQQALRSNPQAFPTDTPLPVSAPAKPAIKWADSSPAPAKTLVQCPHCSAKLSLPVGKTGQVSCPKCSKPFAATT